MAVTVNVDAELVQRARSGDSLAFTELYERHRGAALRLARTYAHGDAEDLVHGAFERVMNAIRGGGGPDTAFRPYLYVTLRHLAMANAAHADEEHLDDVPEGVLAVSGLPAMDDSERALVDKAFSELPERWQAVLWQVAVEGRQPREVARATGLPANTVAVLAHRARERLRQTYLQAHVRASAADACAPHRSRLGAFVRGGLGRRQRAATAEHVASCSACTDLMAELGDVNRMLARSVLPVFVLGAHEGLVLGPGAAALSAGASGAAGTLGNGSLSAGTAGAAAGGAGATVASGAAAGIGTGALAAAAAVVAAVLGFAALVPLEPGAGGEDAPTVEAGAPITELDADATAATDAATSTGLPSTAANVTQTAPPPPPGTAADQPPASDAPATTGAPALDVEADITLDVPQVVDVEVEADIEVGGGSGASVSGAWRVGSVGRGTLVLDVVNPGSAALANAEVLVELSPGAHATSLGTRCRAPGAGPLDLVLGLLGSLTCGLGEVAGGSGSSLELGLGVLGPGQVANVSLVSGGVVVATAVVPLTPA